MELKEIPIFPQNWETLKPRNRAEIPTFECYLDDNKTGIILWCEECREFHEHGDGNHLDKELKIGEIIHRESHCDRFRGDGYYLKLIETPPELQFCLMIDEIIYKFFVALHKPQKTEIELKIELCITIDDMLDEIFNRNRHDKRLSMTFRVRNVIFREELKKYRETELKIKFCIMIVNLFDKIFNRNKHDKERITIIRKDCSKFNSSEQMIYDSQDQELIKSYENLKYSNTLERIIDVRRVVAFLRKKGLERNNIYEFIIELPAFDHLRTTQGSDTVKNFFYNEIWYKSYQKESYLESNKNIHDNLEIEKFFEEQKNEKEIIKKNDFEENIEFIKDPCKIIWHIDAKTKITVEKYKEFFHFEIKNDKLITYDKLNFKEIQYPHSEILNYLCQITEIDSKLLIENIQKFVKIIEERDEKGFFDELKEEKKDSFDINEYFELKNYITEQNKVAHDILADDLIIRYNCQTIFGDIWVYDKKSGLYVKGENIVKKKSKEILDTFHKFSKHVSAEIINHIKTKTYCKNYDFPQIT